MKDMLDFNTLYNQYSTLVYHTDNLRLREVYSSGNNPIGGITSMVNESINDAQSVNPCR